MFVESWNNLKSSGSVNPGYGRELETRIRFAINKLALLGFKQVSDKVVEILAEHPWITRKPAPIVESLAHQDYAVEIINLFTHHESNPDLLIGEYLRSIILRAIRFLPTIGNKHWNILTRYAMTGSLIERLMATETWLYLSDTPGFLNQEQYIEEIQKILRDNTEPHTRLQKNYLLLTGLYDSKGVHNDLDVSTDPMLREAYEMSLKGDISDLLDYQEPKLLRDNFYSGQLTGVGPDYDPPY